MRLKKVETTIKRYQDQSEHYMLIFKTNDTVLEAKVDKENLRQLIETIDNEIL